MADEAKTQLSELTLDQAVTLYHGGRREDRHRRRLAHLYLEDGTWVQGEMLRRRFARVYSFRDNRSLVSEMLALEKEARDARRGLWRLDYYRVRRSEPDAVKAGRFELVEGQIVSAAIVRARAYLNFGSDWSRDVTATLAPKHLGLFNPTSTVWGSHVR